MTAIPNPKGSYPICDDAFTPEELDAIIAHGDRLNLDRGTLAVAGAGGNVVDESLRIVRSTSLHIGGEIAWVYERIERIIRALNEQVYKFEVTGFSEPFEYMVYEGEEGGHFGWHVDNGRQLPVRKLSATLQLTEGDSYEGCDLEIFGTKQFETAPRRRGAMMVFPSYVPHRVTLIRAGTRKALVIWSTGPQFR